MVVVFFENLNFPDNFKTNTLEVMQTAERKEIKKIEQKKNKKKLNWLVINFSSKRDIDVKLNFVGVVVVV